MKVSEILEVIGDVAGDLVIAQSTKHGDKGIGIQDIIKYQDVEVDSLTTYSDGSLLVMLKPDKGGESNETT